MRRLFFIGFVFFAFAAHASESLVGLRELFYRSSKNSDSADSLFEKLQHVSENNEAVYIGYKGMAELLVCYHSYNPYTKFKNFIKGKNSLEQAIAKDPTNIEIRFLRLTVQLNAPPFLGYNKKVDEDKRAIFEGIKKINDRDLYVRITNYTLASRRISIAEKEIVKKAVQLNPLSRDKAG